MIFLTQIFDRKIIDRQVNRVVNHDHQHGANFGRRAYFRFRFAPRPLFRAHDQIGEAITIDDYVRAEDHEPSPTRARNQRERRGINQRVNERNAKVRSFVARHPIGLQHVVADEVADELIHALV